MKSSRTYRQGRSIEGWRKCERIDSLTDVTAGDVYIMDSHQFQATNLVRVSSLGDPTRGFNYTYLSPEGRITSDYMFTHEFELGKPYVTFYRAEKRTINMKKPRFKKQDTAILKRTFPALPLQGLPQPLIRGSPIIVDEVVNEGKGEYRYAIKGADGLRRWAYEDDLGSEQESLF